jgi:Flp pilus assembly protein TadB
MRFRVKMCVSMLVIAALFGLAGIPARAQDKQHVVSLSDLNKDAARPAQTRQANEEAVRTLLSSDQGQKALKSAKLDYQKVDKAVGQLSDEDLAKLAERSRQAQNDFAAGRISDRDMLWIILIAIGIIVLAVALR